MTVAEIQRALLARGYDLGPSGADNALGRLTIAAVTAFQKAEKLDILYPGTIGPKTIAALGLSAIGPVAPPWIAEARRYLGLHERKDAARLDKALRLDASEIPWCGSFVGMVVAATLPREVLPVNPLGARNWLKFGTEVKEPQIGAVAVFWRGTKAGWSGHVGFVVGHDKTHLHILGGNQSDSVSVARIAKDRLLGYRWPRTAPDMPTGKLALSTISASVTTNEA
ncbi:TIGR02594 family protein [Methylobacterium sp. DM1]|nr:TIGR02594 family protein [Methylobacterium sp. DM1]